MLTTFTRLTEIKRKDRTGRTVGPEATCPEECWIQCWVQHHHDTKGIQT